jgi:hypothetical protein
MKEKQAFTCIISAKPAYLFLRPRLLVFSNMNGLRYRSPFSTNKGISAEDLERVLEVILVFI